MADTTQTAYTRVQYVLIDDVDDLEDALSETNVWRFGDLESAQRALAEANPEWRSRHSVVKVTTTVEDQP